jgi:hypothetical protein
MILVITEPVGKGLHIPFLGGISRGPVATVRIALTMCCDREGGASIGGGRGRNIGSRDSMRYAVGANIGPGSQRGLDV